MKKKGPKAVRSTCAFIALAGGAAGLFGSIYSSDIMMAIGCGIMILSIILLYAFYRCPYCGKSLMRSPGLHYCPHCGKSLDEYGRR
ncbi:MAG: hypothetical protein IJM17_04800 [Firmicutes bacterium]|nr:hypothetical protein [Bacillota bacterium]